MPVTSEQNIAVRTAIRNDLRYITPGVPMRYWYRRGPWRPKSAVTTVDLGGDEVPEEPVVPEAPVPEVVESAVVNIATAVTHTIVAGVVVRCSLRNAVSLCSPARSA